MNSRKGPRESTMYELEGSLRPRNATLIRTGSNWVQDDAVTTGKSTIGSWSKEVQNGRAMKRKPGKGSPSGKEFSRKTHQMSDAGGSRWNENESVDELESELMNIKLESIDDRDCQSVKCKRGGRCVEGTMQGGWRCQCLLGTRGEFCEEGKVVVIDLLL